MRLHTRPAMLRSATMSGLRVDRARYLALVGSIAAIACGTSTTTTPPTRAEDAGPVDDAAIEDARAEPDARRPDADSDAGCQDDDGIATETCDGLPTAFTGCATRSTCLSYASHFKSRVARNAIACLRAAVAVDASCVDCSRDALLKACPDPAAAATCNEVAAICTDAGKPDSARTGAACVAGAAGLTPGGRLSFLSCMTESACMNGLDLCLRTWR